MGDKDVIKYNPLRAKELGEYIVKQVALVEEVFERAEQKIIGVTGWEGETKDAYNYRFNQRKSRLLSEYYNVLSMIQINLNKISNCKQEKSKQLSNKIISSCQ